MGAMTTFMNEDEIEEAWELYEQHPVLGPAVQTLRNLVQMANTNSDGWAYWKAPSQAAAKLVTLIRRDGTAKYVFDAERPDATVAEYKKALTPLKAFRTRAVRDHGRQCHFDIIEPGKGTGGAVWALQQELAEAERVHEHAQRAERAAMEMRRRVGHRLAEAEQRQQATEVLAELVRQRDALDDRAHRDSDVVPGLSPATYGDVRQGDRLDGGGLRDALPRLIALATPGTEVWLLLHGDGDQGVGQVGVSLGMTGPTSRHLVVIKTEGHDAPYNWLRLLPVAVLTLAEARERWWITDARSNVVSGGHRDRKRMLALVDEEHPGCQVQRGSEFMPPVGGLACPTCGLPLEYAGEFDGRLPSSGVTDGHEGFGATYECERGHWFTLLRGRLVGAEDILTVVEGDQSS